MLAIVFPFRQWRNFLQGAEHKAIVYYDHQNLTYFITAVLVNKSQARWAEYIQPFDFDLYYRYASSNLMADMFSRCLGFTSREGGTTASGNQTL